MLALGTAHALDATQVFEKASPSVWVVRTYDDAERPVGQGSAVVIAPGRLITNCHVLAKSKSVLVRRENVMYQATLEHADAPRDLCQLQVANFHAPAAQLRPVGELKVGERVFAIGNPQGFEVTLSEGLISGLRGELPGLPVDQGGGSVVQTTAPISPGSSGGGLFDAEGRLIGVTSLIRRNAQNINIALPTDWISEIPARAQAALVARSAPQAAATAAAPGLPRSGTAWVYAYSERIFGRSRAEFTVKVLGVDSESVQESLSVQGGRTSQQLVSPRDPLILERPIGASTILLEAPPYLLAGNGDQPPGNLDALAGYPRGESTMPHWVFHSNVGTWEEVNVPAGTFRALRVELRGERAPTNTTAITSPMTGRFELIAWYSPEVRRYVKLEHKAWSGSYGSRGQQINHDVVEMLSHRPPS